MAGDRGLLVLALLALVALPVLPASAQVQWTTSVNGQPWVEGMEIDVEFADTIQIEDTFTNTGGGTVAVDLDQTFVTSEVNYISHTATSGTVSQPTGQVLWATTLSAGQSATLTVWYSVAQCNWPASTIQRLWVGPSQWRDVTLNKWLHDLQIDSTYEPLVFSGQQATFQLQAGNNGGYENNVQIWCAFSPDGPFGDSIPPADFVDSTGLSANWELGDLANGNSTSIQVTVDVEAGLPVGTHIPTVCSIQDHTGAPVADIPINQITAATTLWETTVNAQPWFPGYVSVNETGDIIEIVEDLFNRSTASSDSALSQSFQPSELSLVDVTVSDGVANQNPGLTEWNVQIGVGQTVTMTSVYSVEPCTWTESAIDTLLLESNESRGILVEKIPAGLWIESTYEPLVLPGQPALFNLAYGNAGGYENDVSLWCNFPDPAPFEGSQPSADFVDPSGATALWNLGDLASDDTGAIEVTVSIQEGLPPDTPIEISCTIHDHTDAVSGETVINLLTVDAFAIFEDGFESGDTSQWSDTVP